jgi:hypothetical protein
MHQPFGFLYLNLKLPWPCGHGVSEVGGDLICGLLVGLDLQDAPAIAVRVLIVRGHRVDSLID